MDPFFPPPKLFNSSASGNINRSAGLNDDGPSDYTLPSGSSSSSEDTVMATYNNSGPTVDRNSHADAPFPSRQGAGPSGASVEGLRQRITVLEGRTNVLKGKTELLQKKQRLLGNDKGLAELVAAFFRWIGAVYLWWIGVMAIQRVIGRGARGGRKRSRGRDSEPRPRGQGQGT